MTLAEPELRQRRGRGRPHVWGPLWSLVCGAVSAWPVVSPLLLARLTAALFVTGRVWSRLWPSVRDDEAERAPEDRDARSTALDLWLLGSLVLLVNPRAVPWLVVGAFLTAAAAVLRRQAPGAQAAVDLMASVARIAMPGWLGWLAASADRVMPPALVTAMAPLPGMGAALRLYALPLAVWTAFTAVDFAVSAQGRLRGEPRWRGPLLLSAYFLLALVLAAHGRSLTAAFITMLAAVQLPMLGALDHGRRRWYAQAAQLVSVVALLAAAAAVAAGTSREDPAAHQPRPPKPTVTCERTRQPCTSPRLSGT